MGLPMRFSDEPSNSQHFRAFQSLISSRFSAQFCLLELSWGLILIGSTFPSSWGKKKNQYRSTGKRNNKHKQAAGRLEVELLTSEVMGHSTALLSQIGVWFSAYRFKIFLSPERENVYFFIFFISKDQVQTPTHILINKASLHYCPLPAYLLLPIPPFCLCVALLMHSRTRCHLNIS